MVQVLSVTQPRWLMNIKILLKGAMEESILHVKMVNRPITGDCKAEDGAVSSWFYNQTERLLTIYV